MKYTKTVQYEDVKCDYCGATKDDGHVEQCCICGKDICDRHFLALALQHRHKDSLPIASTVLTSRSAYFCRAHLQSDALKILEKGVI